MWLRILFTVFSITVTSSILAGPSSVFSLSERHQHSSSINLTPDFSNYLDLQMQNIDSVVSRGMFTANGEDSFVRGYSNKVMWYQITLANHLSTTVKRYIVFSSAVTGWLDRYYIDADQRVVSLDRSGSYRHRSLWADHRGAGIFPVTLQPGESITYLFKHSSYDRLDTRVLLQTEKILNNNWNDSTQYSYIFLGMLFAIVISNLIFFIYGREMIYLLYVATASMMAIVAHTLHGTLPIYGMLGGSAFFPYHLNIITYYAICTSLLFAYYFLSVHRYGWWVWPYRILFGISLLLALFGSVPPFYQSYGYILGIISDILVPIGVLLLLASSLYAIFQRNVAARFYLFSWIFIFLGIGSYYATQLGWFSYTPLYNSYVLLGSVVELMVVSFGLAYRFYRFEASEMERRVATFERGKLKRLFKVLSHDLVNKVFVIQNIAKRHARGEHAGSDWLEVLAVSSSIQAIVNNVRQEAKVAHQKDNLSFTAVRVSDMLQEVHGNFIYKLEKKSISWNVDMEDADAIVWVDRSIFVMNVISNIVSNSIKFTDNDGSGAIFITVKSLGQRSSDRVELTFKDNGIGIPLLLQKKIYDGGKETSRRGTDNEPGTGFGMGMIRDYIQLNGGTIHLSSTCRDDGDLTSGTTIVIVLPKGNVA
jgi:two-component system, sensor histidine kinase LadS